jgi:hypothetical protein|tara:strand:- start:166 stop:342 length:177 start_codon:yes stop_codon:yes gene_type:complete
VTLDDLKNKLAQLDEVTLLETLELTSLDLVNRCTDLIENNFDALENLFDETTPWDNDL